VRICNDAGFEHKIITIRQQRKNSIKQMDQPGWVQAEGEGQGGRDWQFSFDPFNGGEIVNLEYTTGGVTTYNTGKSKVDAWFRWRLVLRKGNAAIGTIGIRVRLPELKWFHLRRGMQCIPLFFCFKVNYYSYC